MPRSSREPTASTGILWEYVRNTVFNANDYFANQTDTPRPAYHQNQFGGTVGGPVYIPKLYNGKNKTFFFFDYQGTRINTPSASTSSVPTANMHSSGFTNFQDYFSLVSGTKTDGLGRIYPLATLLDPATTRMVAAGALDPVSGLANTSGSRHLPSAIPSILRAASPGSPTLRARPNT